MKPIKSLIKLAVAPALAVGFIGCSSAEHLKSLDKAQINDSIPAGVDFYEHVTSIWQQQHPLTAEFSRYGQFNILSDTNEVRVKNLVLGLADSNPCLLYTSPSPRD